VVCCAADICYDYLGVILLIIFLFTVISTIIVTIVRTFMVKIWNRICPVRFKKTEIKKIDRREYVFDVIEDHGNI
jgi:hypothetical protein